MTPGPARRAVGPVVVVMMATSPVFAGCGWGTDVGTGSKTDPESVTDPDREPESEPEPKIDTDAEPKSSAPDAARVAVTVDRIVDGDSIELIVDGSDVELRLEGYNAPELFGDGGDGADTQTCNGQAARTAVDAIVEQAGSIELIEGEPDRFGRTLGDLMIDDESLVDRLIADGRGLATGADETRRAAMVEAASARSGVWGDGCGQPVYGRLAIGDMQVDAPGNDRYNLAEEYVEVVNTGDEITDLDGWVLRDDTTGHQFPLPGSLAAGERLRVVTGAEPPGSALSATHYLNETFPVWSNEWETVILVDPSGVFTDWRFVTEGRVLLE